jgi:threonine dehydrogenase-like Zn-dependent dehydrogenase
MKALFWHGKVAIRLDTVPDPKIEHPLDAVIKVTSCGICRSDLHLYNGVMPEMESGDVGGHETMGEVVEVGSELFNVNVGDRGVVPFTCGECFFCKLGYFSGCECTHLDAVKVSKLWGHSLAAMSPFKNKGLTMRPGQTHLHKYMPHLMKLIGDERIDPSGHYSSDSKPL